jgi:hypothetical protein
MTVCWETMGVSFRLSPPFLPPHPPRTFLSQHCLVSSNISSNSLMSAPNFYNQPVIDGVFYSTPVMSSRFSEIEELPDNLPAPLSFPMGLIAPTNNDPATPSDFITRDEMIRQSGIDFDAPDPNPYVEPEDTRVAVDIHIDYVIYLEKQSSSVQIYLMYSWLPRPPLANQHNRLEFQRFQVRSCLPPQHASQTNGHDSGGRPAWSHHLEGLHSR